MEDQDGPVCARCETTSSLMWNKSDEGTILCLECHRSEKSASKAPSSTNSRTTTPSSETPPPGNGGQTTSTPGRRTRMKERTAKARQAKAGSTSTAEKGRSGANGQAGGQPCTRNNPHAHQLKGRRTLTKEQQQPTKAPKSQATIVTSDAIFHKVREAKSEKIRWQKGAPTVINSVSVLFSGHFL